MQVEGETLRLQLWDTAGQERFRSLIPSYVRDADVCLIVVDVSLRTSIDGIDRWLDFVR
jgi:small GTP-binding protein